MTHQFNGKSKDAALILSVWAMEYSSILVLNLLALVPLVPTIFTGDLVV